MKEKATVTGAAPIVRHRRREWIQYSDINFNGNDFNSIGMAFEATGKCRKGKIGSAQSILFRQRDLVDFAVHWIEHNR
jgi:aminoglycoside 3-N-acetyltransferase